jgi:hypothetical protein
MNSRDIHNKCAEIAHRIGPCVEWKHDINRVMADYITIEDKNVIGGYISKVIPGRVKFVFSTYYSFDEIVKCVEKVGLTIISKYPGDTTRTITSRHVIIISTRF